MITKRLRQKHQRIRQMSLELLEYMTHVYQSHYFYQGLNDRQLSRLLLKIYEDSFFAEIKQKIVKLVALWVAQSDYTRYKAIVELKTKLIELSGPLPSEPKNIYDIYPKMNSKSEIQDSDTQNLNPTETKLLKDLETVDKISSELNRIIVEDTANESKYKLYNVLLVSRDKLSSLLNDSSGYSIAVTQRLKAINTKVNNIISKCNFKKQPTYSQPSQPRKNSNPFAFEEVTQPRKQSNPFEDEPIAQSTNPFDEFGGKPKTSKQGDMGLRIQFGKRASNTDSNANPFEGFNFPTSFKQQQTKPTQPAKEEDFLGITETKQEQQTETDLLGLNLKKEEKPLNAELEFLSMDPDKKQPPKQDDLMNVDLI